MTHEPVTCDICNNEIGYIKNGGPIESIVCPECYKVACAIAGELKDRYGKEDHQEIVRSMWK